MNKETYAMELLFEQMRVKYGKAIIPLTNIHIRQMFPMFAALNDRFMAIQNILDPREELVPDDYNFNIPLVVVNTMRACQNVRNHRELSKIYKCLQSTYIDAIGEYMSKAEGLSSEATDKTKVEIHGEFLKCHAAIDIIAESVFKSFKR